MTRIAGIWIPRVLLILALAGAGAGILRKHLSHRADGTLEVKSDVLAYVSAADNMARGANIYIRPDGESNSYVYPPFLAFTFLPLTLLPPLLIDIGWFVLNLFLIGVIISQAYALFRGERFSSLPRRQQWWFASLAIILSIRYLVRNAQDANINLLLLALIVGGVFLMRTRGRPSWAALIGIAAAIKILPVVFVVYFAARREWRGLAWMLGAAAAATVLPATFMGIDRWWDAIHAFVAYAQRQWSPQGLEIENFSLWGFLGRVFAHSKAFDGPGALPVYVNVADLPLGMLQYAVYGIDALLLVTLYRVVHVEKMKQGVMKHGGVVVTLLVMNLISILTEDHHTVTFMVATLFLLVAWREEGERVMGWVAVAVGLMGILLSHDVIVPLFGKTVYNTMLSFALPVLPCGLLLFIMTWTVTVRVRPAT